MRLIAPYVASFAVGTSMRVSNAKARTELECRPGPPRVLAEGDLLLAEASCCFGMRESQHQIAIAVAGVHPDAARAARIARESYDAGRQALRPAHTFGDVVRAMRGPIADSGSWN